jgi:hypothetical protein
MFFVMTFIACCSSGLWSSFSRSGTTALYLFFSTENNRFEKNVRTTAYTVYILYIYIYLHCIFILYITRYLATRALKSTANLWMCAMFQNSCHCSPCQLKDREISWTTLVATTHHYMHKKSNEFTATNLKKNPLRLGTQRPAVVFWNNLFLGLLRCQEMSDVRIQLTNLVIPPGPSHRWSISTRSCSEVRFRFGENKKYKKHSTERGESPTWFQSQEQDLNAKMLELICNCS